jgi:hypothetical protein
VRSSVKAESRQNKTGPPLLKSTSVSLKMSNDKENRFNRLLPALGYISHDFKSASSSRKSDEAWITSKPNRILQGIEPY